MILFAIIMLFLAYKVFARNTQTKEIINSTAPVVEMATDTKMFDLTILKRLDGRELKFYKRKEPLELKAGISQVRGYYFRKEDEIYVDNTNETDLILHELFHAVDIGDARKGSEDRAYDFQQLYWQLRDKKIITNI